MAREFFIRALQIGFLFRSRFVPSGANVIGLLGGVYMHAECDYGIRKVGRLQEHDELFIFLVVCLLMGDLSEK